MVKQLQMKMMLLLAAVLGGVSYASADTTYKLTEVTSVSAGNLYVFEQKDHVMINSVSNSALQTTDSYKTTKLTGTETYVWTLETADGAFYMKNVSLSSYQYLNGGSGSTSVSFGNKSTKWSFNFSNGTVVIQNANNRFLGYTSVSSYDYKAYASSNLSSGTYPHAIKVYKLEAETSNLTASDLALTNAPIELNFDLYNNSSARTISYTTSSTGAVSVASSDYATFSVDQTNKTITVTPTTVTPSAQTITVNQAADEIHAAGSATFTISVTNSAPYVQPTEIEITPNYTFWGKTAQFSGDDFASLSGEKDNVSLSWTKGSGSTYANTSAMRFYKDNTLTFTAPEGYVIKSIVIDGNLKGDEVFDQEGFDATSQTWTGSSSTVTMSRPSNAESYATYSKFTITIGLPSSIAAPTFSIESGAYATNLSVELSCATDGASIYYTTDGTTPNASKTLYNGPISVTTTTTIKAVAIKDGELSNYSIANYFIKKDVVFSINDKPLPFGDSYTITSGTTNGCDVKTDGEVSISSSNPSVVSVNGLTITAAAVGTATITITAAEGDTFKADSKTFEITVTGPQGSEEAAAGTAIFTESFSNCSGTGGNKTGTFSNGNQNGSVEGKTDEPDYNTITNAYPAAGCARLGTSSNNGVLEFTVNLTGEATLTFSGAGWSGSDANTIKVTATGATLSGDINVTLANAKWNDYTVNISEATGNVTIKFTEKRGFLDDIIITKPISISVKLNGSGYATYCSQYPLDFTNAEANGYSAWQITDIDGENKITFTQITGSVKGGTGIFLKGEAGGTVTLTSSDSSNELSDNLLEGTLAPTYVETGKYYGLSGDSFVKVNAGTVKAGKALINADWITESAGARFTFIFADATGISEVEHGTLNAEETVYDLQGRRVVKVQKGLYIVNGKKVMVK